MKNLLFNNRKITSGRHRGMTLVELLVVSAIMVILMSISITVLTPIAENRMNRESARGVQSALESARARAIRLGRCCGVTLMPFHQNYPYCCITIEQMTAPPSYESNSLPSLQKGDTYQINGTGPYLQANDPSHLAGFNSNLKYNVISNPDFYLIHKFPVSETSNAFAKALGIEASYSLPKGYIVDLYHSSNANTPLRNYTFSNKKPPVILFRPDGSASLYMNGGEIRSEDTSNNSGKIILLVGEWGRMMDGNSTLAEDGKNNTQVYNTYWVVISTKTGEVHCVRNLGNDTNTTNVAGGR